MFFTTEYYIAMSWSAWKNVLSTTALYRILPHPVEGDSHTELLETVSWSIDICTTCQETVFKVNNIMTLQHDWSWQSPLNVMEQTCGIKWIRELVKIHLIEMVPYHLHWWDQTVFVFILTWFFMLFSCSFLSFSVNATLSALSFSNSVLPPIFSFCMVSFSRTTYRYKKRNKIKCFSIYKFQKQVKMWKSIIIFYITLQRALKKVRSSKTIKQSWILWKW